MAMSISELNQIDMLETYKQIDVGSNCVQVKASLVDFENFYHVVEVFFIMRHMYSYMKLR